MYWVDAKLRRMEVADLDGTSRQILRNNGLMHPFAIDNFGENIYWTDWKTDKLSSMNKFEVQSFPGSLSGFPL